MIDDEDEDKIWYSTDGGRTLDRLGLEGGYILRDEELGDPDEPEDADARITCEQGRVDNPGFFVTAQLYGGWFYLTVKHETRESAELVYAELRGELEKLAALLPYEDQRDIEIRAAKLTEAAQAVEDRYR